LVTPALLVDRGRLERHAVLAEHAKKLGVVLRLKKLRR
jgi:hypothetical protein